MISFLATQLRLSEGRVPFPVPPFASSPPPCGPCFFPAWSGHPLSRLIALISSDSDYCCLRIVQLMCELRHHRGSRFSALGFLFSFYSRSQREVRTYSEEKSGHCRLYLWTAGGAPAPLRAALLLAPKYDVMDLACAAAAPGLISGAVSRDPKKGNF